MILDRTRYAALRGGERLAALRALTIESSTAIGEDLLRSDLMRFVRPSEARPLGLARSVRALRTPPSAG